MIFDQCGAGLIQRSRTRHAIDRSGSHSRHTCRGPLA
jgi:hypothetical protein